MKINLSLQTRNSWLRTNRGSSNIMFDSDMGPSPARGHLDRTLCWRESYLVGKQPNSLSFVSQNRPTPLPKSMTNFIFFIMFHDDYVTNVHVHLNLFD